MKQYVDFYNSQKEQIFAHAPQILNDVRSNAFDQFVSLGLTHKDADYYRFFDLQEAFAPNYGLNITRLTPTMDNSFHCNVPTITDCVFYMVNDSLLESNAPLPEGVTLCSLRQACHKFPELVKQHYASLTSTDKDGTQAFNISFAQDGLFIHVADGAKVNKPLQIVNLLHGNREVMSIPHNLIIIGHQAEAKLVICDHVMDNVPLMSNAITEIILEEGAQCDYYRIESTNHQTTNLHTLYVNEAENAHMNACLINLHNGKSRNNTIINLCGKGAEINLSGMFIGSNQQVSDNATTINHLVAGCHSNQLFKYVLDNEAQGNFLGRILVAEGASQTEAFQVNRNICLTNTARMRTKPQLEIYNDDVKCNHGATIGQLDDTALFYMRQRGIPESEARLLLLGAFVSDVLSNIQIEALRDKILLLAEKRLRGDSGNHCEGCQASCITRK